VIRGTEAAAQNGGDADTVRPVHLSIFDTFSSVPVQVGRYDMPVPPSTRSWFNVCRPCRLLQVLRKRRREQQSTFQRRSRPPSSIVRRDNGCSIRLCSRTTYFVRRLCDKDGGGMGKVEAFRLDLRNQKFCFLSGG
jgi:hypothetical protein